MTTTDYHGLGRLYVPDERDKAFPMRALVPTALPTRKYRYWQTGAVLDQGNNPWCVAASWLQWLTSDPIRTLPAMTMKQLYDAAQEVDEWEGAGYSGTSVRAGAQVLESKGHIESYHWAWTAEDVAAFILCSGPVILGTTWYAQMMLADKKGLIYPSGQNLGGHAYLCVGYNVERGLFRLTNSWGRGWGQNGRAWLQGEDLEKLLQDNGEACTAIEKRVAAE